MARKKKDPKISGFKVHELAFEKNDSFYIPYQLKDIDPGELRKEYTRLRDIAQKRIKRLADSPFKDSDAYRYNVDRFKKIKDIKSESELRLLLADLSRFVNTESSTIKGQYAIMARRAETLSNNFPDLHLSDMTPSQQFGFFKFIDYMLQKHGTNMFYHVSSGAQRAIAYDEKIKDMISKGDFDDAQRRIYEIQNKYLRPEDELSEEEIKKAFEVN